MDIVTEHVGGVAVVGASGRLDTTTIKEFEAKIREVLRSGPKALVLDCADMEYLSSAGLRLLLALMKDMQKEQRSFSVCCVPKLIREVMAISGFDSFLRIFPSREEAIKAAGASGGEGGGQ